MDIVTCFTDLASKWIKEHDTRERRNYQREINIV